MDQLSVQQSQKVEKLLQSLIEKAEAKSIFLTDRGGNILVWSTIEQNYNHEDNIAALAAGSFFATRELAKLIGEPEFKCVFHQGAGRSVFMQSTTTDLLLLVVFGDDSNPGLVKLYSNEAIIALDSFLKDTDERTPPGASNVKFEIDKSKSLFRGTAQSG